MGLCVWMRWCEGVFMYAFEDWAFLRNYEFLLYMPYNMLSFLEAVINRITASCFIIGQWFC